MSTEGVQGTYRRLRLQRGDRVLLAVNEPLSESALHQLRIDLEQEFPAHQVVVVTPGLQLAVWPDRCNAICPTEEVLRCALWPDHSGPHVGTHPQDGASCEWRNDET